MTYEQFAECLALLLVSIGMYFMGTNHTAHGLWVRSSAGRVYHRARRAWRVLCGKPVVVLSSGLASNVHDYRLDASNRGKRVVIFPDC